VKSWALALPSPGGGFGARLARRAPPCSPFHSGRPSNTYSGTREASAPPKIVQLQAVQSDRMPNFERAPTSTGWEVRAHRLARRRSAISYVGTEAVCLTGRIGVRFRQCIRTERHRVLVFACRRPCPAREGAELRRHPTRCADEEAQVPGCVRSVVADHRNAAIAGEQGAGVPDLDLAAEH